MPMLKLKRMFHSPEASLRALAYALSALALAIFFASVSLPAVAQNEAAGVTSHEFKLAYHSRAPHYQYYQPGYRPRYRPRYRPYYQPGYRPRYRPRYRPDYRSSYRPRPLPPPHRHAPRKQVKKPIPPAIWSSAGDSRDPVQIIISLPEQKITVYKGDKELVTSRVSSGKPGYSTPSGVFSILSKNRFHRSNIYSNAPMPFMQRLTWSGIALHGSNDVPENAPASHGCIRLPEAFASQLFAFTQKGVHVIVANEKAAPVEITHDKLFQPAPRPRGDFAMRDPEFIMLRNRLKLAQEKRAGSPIRVLITRRTGRERIKDVQKLLNELAFGTGGVDGYMGPDTARAIRRFQITYGLRTDGLVSDELIAMLYHITGRGMPANGHLYVRRDFNPVFDAPVVIGGGEQPLGSHLYTAMYFEPGATRVRWLAVTLTKGSGINAYSSRAQKKKLKPVEIAVPAAGAPLGSSAQEALGRIEIPQAIRQRINRMLTPGSSLAITNDGISKETTPKGTDFIVLMQ